MVCLKSWVKFSIICVTIFSSTGSAKELLDRVVAVVGNDIVLLSDLESAKVQVSRELELLKQEKNKNVKDFEKKVLDQLITEKLVSKEIQKRGMEPQDKDIEKVISSQMQEHNMASKNDLELALQQEGITMVEYRKTLKKQITQLRVMNWIVKPGVKEVSDREVDQVVARKGKKVKAKEINLFMIFLSKEKTNVKKMNALRLKLKSHEDFMDYAKKETDGPGKEEGGRVGFIQKENLQPEFSQALENLAMNEVSQPIQTDKGTYFLKYTDEREIEGTSGVEEKGLVKKEIERQKLAQAFDRFVRKLRSDYDVQVRL